jgi:prophage tail gpP-like protein
MSVLPTPPAQTKPGVNDVTLIVNGRAWKGWQDIRITCGCERMPDTFQVTVTEKFPGAADIDIEPQQPCQVLIGSDPVITGYIDDYGVEYDHSKHSVQITGKSKSEDLVDSSAILPMMQISAATALTLANQLTAPYGITASQIGTPANTIIPQFNVTLGETVYEILERVARYCQFLLYDGPDGNIILAQVGTIKAASGLVEGVNVEKVSMRYSMAERFQTYVAATMSTASLSDIGTGGWQLGTVTDMTVTRLRQKIIVSEQTINGKSLAVARANWEKARRIGRSQAVTVKCDSWRDSAGKLWTKNTLVPVTLPRAKLVNKEWVVSEVVYVKGEEGTHAELTVMPALAFTPEPDPLQAFDWQAQQAINQAGAGKP